MKINHDKNLPIPFIVIEDFYSKEELEKIWQELDFISDESKLLDETETSSAIDTDTQELKKKNLGVFLDEVYTDRSYSNILNLNRKLFDDETIDELKKHDFIFSYIKDANRDTTLLSYYRDGDYYKPHHDEVLFTAITWLYKEPKQFEGGEFKFPEYDITLDCKNGSTIIFPSKVIHEVTKVKIKTKDPWMGRYSITSLINKI